jgi:Holliday junction DNA helicase RuvA
VRDLPRARLEPRYPLDARPAPQEREVRLIGRLTGRLAAKAPPQVLVDVGGVAYELDVPMSTFYNLPATGEAVTLHTHQVVREDAHMLYGFATLEERSAFRQLIRISGIGARTALAVLSGLSVNELAEAVSLQEPGRLTRIPGIGKKTAERLLLELKGKLAEVARAPSEQKSSDVLNALISLGYSEKEAAGAVKGLPAGLAVADGIRAALKALAKP